MEKWAAQKFKSRETRYLSDWLELKKTESVFLILVIFQSNIQKFKCFLRWTYFNWYVNKLGKNESFDTVVYILKHMYWGDTRNWVTWYFSTDSWKNKTEFFSGYGSDHVTFYNLQSAVSTLHESLFWFLAEHAFTSFCLLTAQSKYPTALNLPRVNCRQPLICPE